MTDTLNRAIGVIRRLADGTITQDEFNHVSKVTRAAVAREIQNPDVDTFSALLHDADIILMKARDRMFDFGCDGLLHEAAMKAVRKVGSKSRVAKLRRAARHTTASLFD